LDEILAEPGLDAVLVGPHDLSINLDVPEQYDHPDFMAAISTIISKARAAGVGAGIHFSTGIEKEIRWAKEGANLIMHSSDTVAVLQTLHKDFKRFRDELGDAPAAEAKPEDGIV
jgi:4-hydroxy-2-oxoheptanedioate aldolase